MSFVSDHLSDASMRGVYTNERVSEAMRLASLLATARVRRYAKANGKAVHETKANIDRRVRKAEEALRFYLENIL